MNRRRTALACLIAAVAASFSLTAAAATVIDLNDPANAGRTTWSVPAGTDVTVIGSTTPRDRQISIQGARNVDVRGGVWKPTRREYDGTIHTKNITGSVTISGATIDNSGVRGADGVVVNAGGKTAIPFLMTNSTITGIRGSQGGDHADGVQPQGAVSSFEMENVRIATDYQGLMLADQPNIPYGGKVREIKLTNVGIEKLSGGEGGCRYPIITGGKQTVQLSNVTVYDQSGCRGNGLLNVDNRAQITGQPAYGETPADITGSGAGIGETPPPKPPMITRDDIPKVPLPDNTKQQAALNTAMNSLGTARQILSKATATKMPSMSMAELRQQIAEKNKADCD